MISEAIERRLEWKYAPAQPRMGEHGDSCIRQLEQMSRPDPTPTTVEPLPERRNLPTRVVTDNNFGDAYVDFIMYCNPTVALDTDTTELRRIFRSPPKSDGKSFNTYTLFELIGKLERKEIKTWAQLALDLGVEPPSSEKGHSAQKVQQYSVRLKVSNFCVAASSTIFWLLQRLSYHR